MKTNLILLTAVLSAAASIATPAAAAPVTFVSVHGDDLNTCGAMDPCRTINHALTQTDPYGDLLIIDSGTYADFAVSQPVSIDAAPGVNALISGNSQSATVQIANAGRVVLRGLTIIGSAYSGSGVYIYGTSPMEVHIERCVVADFTRQAISIAGSSGEGKKEVFVKDTILRSNGGGIQVRDGNVLHVDRARIDKSGAAIAVYTGASASISNSELRGNWVGVIAQSLGTASITRVSIERTNFQSNTLAGITAGDTTGNGSVVVNAARNTISACGSGILVTGQNAISITAKVTAIDNVITQNTYSGINVSNMGHVVASGNTITENGGYGISVGNLSTAHTLSNNMVWGNGAGNTSGTITAIPGI